MSTKLQVNAHDGKQELKKKKNPPDIPLQNQREKTDVGDGHTDFQRSSRVRPRLSISLMRCNTLSKRSWKSGSLHSSRMTFNMTIELGLMLFPGNNIGRKSHR
jgi:hypothetical protein